MNLAWTPNLEPLNYLSHSFVYLVFCTASVYSYYHAHVHMMGSIKVFANSPICIFNFFSHPHWPKRCLLLYVVLQVASRLVPVNKPSV